MLLLFLSSFLIVQVSLPYSSTDHTGVLTNLTLKDMHILLHKIFLFLVNASFAIAILHLISLLHFPSSVITESKYLNCSTCSTWCCPAFISTFLPSVLEMTSVLVFLTFILLLYSSAALLKQ